MRGGSGVLVATVDTLNEYEVDKVAFGAEVAHAVEVVVRAVVVQPVRRVERLGHQQLGALHHGRAVLGVGHRDGHRRAVAVARVRDGVEGSPHVVDVMRTGFLLLHEELLLLHASTTKGPLVERGVTWHFGCLTA